MIKYKWIKNNNQGKRAKEKISEVKGKWKTTTLRKVGGNIRQVKNNNYIDNIKRIWKRNSNIKDT